MGVGIRVETMAGTGAPASIFSTAWRALIVSKSVNHSLWELLPFINRKKGFPDRGRLSTNEGEPWKVVTQSVWYNAHLSHPIRVLQGPLPYHSLVEIVPLSEISSNILLLVLVFFPRLFLFVWSLLSSRSFLGSRRVIQFRQCCLASIYNGSKFQCWSDERKTSDWRFTTHFTNIHQ